MKRPSLQWYTKDWRANKKLRLCSWAARGAWSDVLCLLHDDADEYGIIHATLREIANAVGCPFALINELVARRVLKGDDKRLAEPYLYAPEHARGKGEPVVLIPAQDGPIWFSSRMVRDEYLRSIRGAATRWGPDHPSPTQRQGEGSGEAPSRGQGERQGESPSPRKGDGAAFAFALPSMRGSTNSQGGRTREAQGNGEISPQNQPRAPTGWRVDPQATLRYASALGVTALPGETTQQVVAKIDAHLAELRRSSH